MPPPAVAAFADAALRRVLEVIDRRRPLTQLRPLLTAPLLDAVSARTRISPAASATLRRVRLRMADDDGTAAEVFGTYTRGDRIRAIAGRVELSSRTDRWQLVALHIG